MLRGEGGWNLGAHRIWPKAREIEMKEGDKKAPHFFFLEAASSCSSCVVLAESALTIRG